MVRTVRGEGSHQRFPIRDFRAQVRHGDADEPECGEIDTDHPIGLGQSEIDGTVFAKEVPGSNEHSIAAGRWDKCRSVPIAERMQGRTKPRRRRPPAIFGENHDIGVVLL